MSTSTLSGLYLYAIIPTEETILFDVQVIGEENEVYTISQDGLAAVVSASTLADFHGLDRSEAARYLVAHQSVVETVMRVFPLLPVKFGTILADENQVRCMLAQGAEIFHSALDKFAGQVQMEVVVLWNLQPVFQAIAGEPTIQSLKARIENRPAEETMPERIAVGQLVQATLQHYRAALCNEILPPLHELCLDATANPVMDDRMVANTALLVDAYGRQALERRLDELDAAYERGERKTPGDTPLTFRFVGPLPLYNFATVEAQPVPYDTLDLARKGLGLPDTATRSEIKHAYHRAAARLHPDLNPDLKDAEALMTELSQAYRLVEAYADSQAYAGRETCDFSREAAERTLLIAVTRQEG
jgi:hypothetical protein